VFHRDRLVGKLSETESRIAGMMMNKTHNATFTAPVGKMGEVSYRKLVWKRKIKIVKTKPEMEFLINVGAKGFGPELTGDPTELSPKKIKTIEKVTKNYLKKQILTTVRHLQRLNSDIVGFGDLVRAEKPDIWKRLNWDEDYSRVNFGVTVKFTLERVGKYR
jgi:spore germination protein KC